jgi:hypothetical protein
MPEHETHEQPQTCGPDQGPEPAASFGFDAAMWAGCCGPAMNKMAAACRGEPEESNPPAPGEDRVAGRD